jgi:hypothetical protein
MTPFTSAFKLIKVYESTQLGHSQVLNLTPLFSPHPVHGAPTDVAKKRLRVIALNEHPEPTIWILI